MTEILTNLEDMAATLLSSNNQGDISPELIRENLLRLVPIVAETNGVEFSPEEIDRVAKRLETRFDITMGRGTLFAAKSYRPWLDASRGGIDWFYWRRYNRYLLLEQKLPPQVVRSLDSITDQILDHLEDPKKEGKWDRKGMVVGHVQSGKTANYVGLISKAADSGYRVIIVLAGTLNSLRNQTQYRIDSGFIGKDTSAEKKEPIGVGIIAPDRMPVSFTTNTQDFKKAIANSVTVSIDDLRQPVVLVIKKNKSTLENLIDWLHHNNPHNLKDHPMLLIDDEADNASINTNKDGYTATTINSRIRELIQLFTRSSYLGYTATPFANVFIDPDTDHEMLGGDLFPRDFIISLDPPSNYFGPDRIFSPEPELDIVRSVEDHIEYFPLNHKIDWRPEGLPETLKEAIKMFVLIRAIRLARGGAGQHNSMMINVSRFTLVQTHIKLSVEDYVKGLQQSLFSHYALKPEEAMKSSTIRTLKSLFEREFQDAGYPWETIQPYLKDAIAPVGVIEVNSSNSSNKLDYTRVNYPGGRNVIAIGGLGLSRGLTLEGLTVSYFLRNSIMYDTLMQMGRWFGYRDGYGDLCRIYMTADAFSWYAHISDAMEELREEFKRMKAAGMSPQDFGLCVRSHPESLIVTARNKMRTGKAVVRQVSLHGRLVETARLLRQEDALRANHNLLANTVEKMNSFQSPVENPAGSRSFYWANVPVEVIEEFVRNFRNHPASQLTDSGPVSLYIAELARGGIQFWDVALISPGGGASTMTVSDLSIGLQVRSVSTGENEININKGNRRVGDVSHETIGLPKEAVNVAKETYLQQNPGKKSPPGALYRALRERLQKPPLLILHVLDCVDEKKASLFPEGVVAYSISFPGLPGSRRPEKLVEYVVNTTWWNENYFDFIDEDDIPDE